MIQRVQTIYLFVAFIINGALIFVFNLWENTVKNLVFAIDLLEESSILLKSIPIMFFLSSLLSFIAVFLFKNRQTQFVIGRLAILINLILLGILIYVSLTLPGETIVFKKGIGMFLPILAILLLVMANKAIKKDEDLVKSVDRLR